MQLLQVFDNAYSMLEAVWKNNTYRGFGTVIHRVDHDTSKSDFAQESDHERNRDLLAKSLVNAPAEVVDEFRLIMSHFSASLYRWGFQRCQNGGSGGCPVCPEPKLPQTPVELFYEKFGGDFPSPMPFWASFPRKPRCPSVSKGPVECVSSASCVGSRASATGLRYRTFLSYLKLNVPRSMMYQDQHYDGPTARHACPVCRPEVCHRSSAALQRHMRMLHT